jgi:membrane-bound metal-dependent hydrolase YbcI (DUF457 family)
MPRRGQTGEALLYRARMHSYHGWPFLTSPQHPTLSAVAAVFIHGFITLLVALPFIWASGRRRLSATLAFLAGPALDLDHAIVAGSLQPQALETLSHRPDTHSLLFAAALAILALLVTRSKPIAWSVFAVIAVHLLFDAAGGNEQWLYPLKQPDSVPWLAFPLGLFVLLGLSLLVVRAASSLPGPHPIDGHVRWPRRRGVG